MSRIRTRLRRLRRLLPKPEPSWGTPLAYVAEGATEEEIDAAVAEAVERAGNPPPHIECVIYPLDIKLAYDAAEAALEAEAEAAGRDAE